MLVSPIVLRSFIYKIRNKGVVNIEDVSSLVDNVTATRHIKPVHPVVPLITRDIIVIFTE